MKEKGRFFLKKGINFYFTSISQYSTILYSSAVVSTWVLSLKSYTFVNEYQG